VLGLFVVGVTTGRERVLCQSPFERVFDPLANPCDGFPPLPFIDARGGAKREIKEMLQCRSLRCPLARRCPPGCIEEERR
jgi:hypothetical protein